MFMNTIKPIIAIVADTFSVKSYHTATGVRTLLL